MWRAGNSDFSSYYYAAEFAQLPKYYVAVETPMWETIEFVDCDPISVANMLWLQPKDRTHLSNPITKYFLTIWDRFKYTSNLQSSHNLLLSFLRNPAFYPAWDSVQTPYASFPQHYSYTSYTL